jgi:dTDP-4-amino-4,6-dideoxygalactose transaminase
VGFNYRMTDIQGAVGRVQLRRLPELLVQRGALAEHYTRAFRSIPGLVPPHVPDYARPNYQSYAVRVTPEFPLPRDQLMQMLLENGISTRRGIMNAHQERAYSDAPSADLPHSEAARDSVVLLPLYNALTTEYQMRLIGLLLPVPEPVRAC